MWAPMCMISLLWSIGTDLTRCDFALGSEQAWRNERLALSDMAVVLVQSQSGCSTGLGPVEAFIMEDRSEQSARSYDLMVTICSHHLPRVSTEVK